MGPELESKRILLVEDERFMLAILAMTLKEMGFATVDEAESGEEALEKIVLNQYDLVITDVEMGELNGLGLIRLIRTGATSLPVDTRIIVLTGLSEVSVLSEAVSLDIQGFMVKPTSKSLLIEKVEQAFIGSVKLKTYHKQAKGVVEHPSTWINPYEKNKSGEGLKVEAANQVTEVEIELEKLAKGMVLIDEITTARGAVLIKAGETIRDMHVQVLHDLRAMIDQDKVKAYLPEY